MYICMGSQSDGSDGEIRDVWSILCEQSDQTGAKIERVFIQMQCYQCQGYGHKARDCPNSSGKGGRGGRGSPYKFGRGGRRGGGSPARGSGRGRR